MSEDLIARIQRKVGEAFAKQWPGAPKLAAVLDADTRYDETAGGVIGGISVNVTLPSGEFVTVHHEPANGLRTADDVDDWLARALSSMLTKHTSWPN